MVGALRTAGAQKDRGARPGTGPSGQRSKREVVSDRGWGASPATRLRSGCCYHNSIPPAPFYSVPMVKDGIYRTLFRTMRSLSSLSFVSLPLRRDRAPPGFYVLPGWALSVLKADILAGHCRPREMAPRSVSPRNPSGRAQYCMYYVRSTCERLRARPASVPSSSLAFSPGPNLFSSFILKT